jgi:hypothetical protein
MFAQGNASSGGNVSGITVSSIALPRASQSDIVSTPSGSFDLMSEVNIRGSADEDSDV